MPFSSLPDPFPFPPKKTPGQQTGHGEIFGSYGPGGAYEPAKVLVCPMEQVKVAIDDEHHTVILLLERAGTHPSPAISLRVGEVIALIQSLRMGINDIEMLPPSEQAMLT